MSSRLSRRDLIRLALAAPFVYACGKDKSGPAPEAVRSWGKTIIVGGGIAGLALLARLRVAGVDATLLEGSQRVGGRMYTMRTGVPEGLHAEAGAERVGATHVQMRGLMQALGIEVEPLAAMEEPFRIDVGGEVYIIDDPNEPPAGLLAGLTEVEKKFGPSWIDIAIATSATAPTPNDPRTAMKWLKDSGLSARGEVLVRAFSAHPLDRITAVDLHRIAIEDFEAFDWGRVTGGTSRVTDALAAGLRDRIVFGKQVDRVFLNTAALPGGSPVQAGVGCKDGSTFIADRVVLAMPLRPLQALTWLPSEPAPVRPRLDALFPSDQVKVYVEIPAAGTSGFTPWHARTSYPRMTWVAAGQSRDGRRLMGTMATETDLVPVRALLGGGASALGSAIANTIPGFPTKSPATFVHDFGRDPLAGGSGVYSRKSAPATRGPIIDGRVAIIGSDLSDMPGWMEGALRSVDALCATWKV